jgi:adenylyltransferase/sulfurtransferase
MPNFHINELHDSEKNPYDRQERLDWWSQEKVSTAKIMVVGAGATGNETIKNLCLLGVKNILIIDMDEISITNLSRTILFRKEDVGKKKAEIAAQRARELSLAKDTNIYWYHGDAVWELGTGLYKSQDLILGCVDSVETRLEINRQSWLAKKPWIDSGINELGMHVTVFEPPNSPCYQCSLTINQQQAARKRYSCDDFKKKIINDEKVPTVQITAAIASAIQTQEAMKLICGQKVISGRIIYFQGRNNDFDINQIQRNPNCTAHLSYPKVFSLPYTTEISLKQFLEIVSDPKLSGLNATLDFAAFRRFIKSANCRSCGKEIMFYKPSFKILTSDLICDDCQKKGLADGNHVTAKIYPESEFKLGYTDEKILSMSLHDLGVPYWPILAIKDSKSQYQYYELSGDKNKIFSK